MSATALRASLRLWRWRRNQWHNRIPKVHGAKRKALQAKIKHANTIIARRKQQLADSRPPRRSKDGWMPGVPRHYATSGTPWQVDCPSRGVLHTTEGHGDATTTLDAKRAWPHFEVMENGSILQYFPLTVGGRALVHDGPPTNGAHAFQIEISGAAAHANLITEGHPQRDALKRVMRFIESDGGVERAAHVKFVNGGSARLTPEKWLALKGWCGHQHVPGNDHVDPGPINIKELLA